VQTGRTKKRVNVTEIEYNNFLAAPKKAQPERSDPAPGAGFGRVLSRGDLILHGLVILMTAGAILFVAFAMCWITAVHGAGGLLKHSRYIVRKHRGYHA